MEYFLTMNESILHKHFEILFATNQNTMNGMCDIYYSSGVKIALTEVKGIVNNPFGVVTISLCEKCRD